MNFYIDAQITNMITIVKTFEHSCETTATKTDGTIDRAEAKQLKKIHAAARKFIKDLEAIK